MQRQYRLALNRFLLAGPTESQDRGQLTAHRDDDDAMAHLPAWLNWRFVICDRWLELGDWLPVQTPDSCGAPVVFLWSPAYLNLCSIPHRPSFCLLVEALEWAIGPSGTVASCWLVKRLRPLLVV